MALAQGRHTFDVALAGKQHPARAHDRLAEERGHTVRPDPVQLLLQRLHGVVRDVRDTAYQWPEAGAVHLDAADGGAEPEHAMEALGASDHVRALIVPGGGEVQPGKLGRGLDAVAPAGSEEHARVVQRRERREAASERDRRLVGLVAERRVGVELADLCGDRVGHPRAAVTDVGVPQAGGGVEVARAFAIPQPHVLGAVEHELVAGHLAHVREGVPQPVGVGGGDIHRARA